MYQFKQGIIDDSHSNKRIDPRSSIYVCCPRFLGVLVIGLPKKTILHLLEMGHEAHFFMLKEKGPRGPFLRLFDLFFRGLR